MVGEIPVSVQGGGRDETPRPEPRGLRLPKPVSQPPSVAAGRRNTETRTEGIATPSTSAACRVRAPQSSTKHRDPNRGDCDGPAHTLCGADCQHRSGRNTETRTEGIATTALLSARTDRAEDTRDETPRPEPRGLRRPYLARVGRVMLGNGPTKHRDPNRGDCDHSLGELYDILPLPGPDETPRPEPRGLRHPPPAVSWLALACG